MKDAAEDMTSDRKRKQTGKAENVEKALYTWFGDARARDAPIRQFATTCVRWISLTSRLLMNGWLYSASSSVNSCVNSPYY